MVGLYEEEDVKVKLEFSEGYQARVTEALLGALEDREELKRLSEYMPDPYDVWMEDGIEIRGRFVAI